MHGRIILLALAVGGLAHIHAADAPVAITTEQAGAWRARATATLLDVLHREPSWVGIHAAEALIRHGEGDMVRKIFPGPAGAKYPRVGRLRVLATLTSEPEKNSLIRQIEAIFIDSTAPDRTQAIETLAKLRHPLSPAARALAQSMAREMPASDAVLPLWSLYFSGDTSALPQLTRLLTAEDPVARQRTAYALRWIGAKDPVVLKALNLAAARETQVPLPRVYLLSSALQLGAGSDSVRRGDWSKELFSTLTTGPSAAAFEAGQVLGPWITAAEIPVLLRLLESPEGDTQVGAALLLLSFAGHP